MDKTKTDIPLVLNDPGDQMVRHIKSRYPGFNQMGLSQLKSFPVVSDAEAILHYLRGVSAPFIDFITLIEIGCGINLIPMGFESDDDGHEAKKVVEKQFEKMDMDDTMLRYATFGEILGRRCNVRTYNQNGGFYYNEKEMVTGIDVINPMSLDMQSVERALYDRTGTVEFKQNLSNSLGDMGTVSFSQDRVDYTISGGLMKFGVWGNPAISNCVTDLRTAASAPGLRLDLMKKQANVYMHLLMDVSEILKTPMGKKALDDWESAEKALQSQLDEIKKQRRDGGDLLSWSFLKPAQATGIKGKDTDFSSTEENTYSVIAMKMGVPLPLITKPESVRNRSTLEIITDTFVRKREASGGRKVFRKHLMSYAQEIKAQEGILEGYFQIEFKPFLQKDLKAVLDRMNTLFMMGAASKTEVRRSQDMADAIDFGLEDESSDYQIIPNSNPHLEPPTNSVQKKDRMANLSKTLKELNLIG